MDKLTLTALLIVGGVVATGVVVTTLTPVGSSTQSVVKSQKKIDARIEADIKVVKVHPKDSQTLKVLVKNILNQNNVSFSKSNFALSYSNSSKIDDIA